MSDNRTTELLDGLRHVGNLHEFAELFGFDWCDDSDWVWHDVAVKMADDFEQAIAATLGEYSYDWQAIADELNARAERTCEIESSYLNDFTVKNMCWYEFEMKCGYKFTWDVMEPPKFCPNCGCKVVGA